MLPGVRAHRRVVARCLLPVVPANVAHSAGSRHDNRGSVTTPATACQTQMPVHGAAVLGSFGVSASAAPADPFDCIDAHYGVSDGFAAVLLGNAASAVVVLSGYGMNCFPHSGSFDL